VKWIVLYFDFNH